MLALLDRFAEAWNRHDLDALMSMMTDDCVFEASAGNAVDGERSEGQAAVRAAFAAVFEQFPDARWDDPTHFIQGDRGVSEWTFRGTPQNGKRVEVRGCDLFTFRDGKIAVKNSFRKNRPPPEIDLFAGIPVSDYDVALDWYGRLLGSPPAFFPNDREAVWEIGAHRYLYIEHLPERAGQAMHTLFVNDLDERMAQIAARGLNPTAQETYANGVRKITYRDPDGNEIGLGGASSGG